ncbi:hypothetical protein F4777DRAFT_547870 [Nemania sp. FL0916]|nr:hypothetical protein F4777DRAFT_547870 [Nemania sp. FL0916]
MDRLPQEIYYEIGAFLKGPDFDLPALATISRRWQAVIERQTFRTIYMKSTDLDSFQAIVQGDRRQFVHTICFTVILPSHGLERQYCFERDNDRRVNDEEAFSVAMHDLFHILKSWDVTKHGHVMFGLKDVYSQTDGTLSPLSVTDIGRWRHRYSYIRLLRPSALPLVPVVLCRL